MLDGGGVKDRDVEVVGEDQGVGSSVGLTDADVAERAAESQGGGAGPVDPVAARLERSLSRSDRPANPSLRTVAAVAEARSIFLLATCSPKASERGVDRRCRRPGVALDGDLTPTIGAMMAIDLTELLDAAAGPDVTASLSDMAQDGASGVLAAMAAMPLIDPGLPVLGQGLAGVNNILSMMDGFKDLLPLPGGFSLADMLGDVGQSSVAGLAAGLGSGSLLSLATGAESTITSLFGDTGTSALESVLGLQTSLAEQAVSGLLGTAASSFLNPQVSGILDGIRPFMMDDASGFSAAFKSLGSSTLAASALSGLDPELVTAWAELGLKPSTAGVLRDLDFDLVAPAVLDDLETVPASPEVERYERLVETQAETVSTLARVSQQLSETQAIVAALAAGDDRFARFDRRLTVAAFVVATVIGVAGLAVGIAF